MVNDNGDIRKHLEDILHKLMTVRINAISEDEYHISGRCSGYDLVTGGLCKHPACVERRQKELEKEERKREMEFQRKWQHALFANGLEGFEWIKTAEPNDYQKRMFLAIENRFRISATGKTGIGKTAGALMICYKRRLIPEIVHCSILGEHGEFSNKKLQNLGQADALIIDDLGLEGPNIGTQRLSFLVDARDKSHKLTIITTNLSVEQLRERYDDRTLRRIAPIVDLRTGAIFVFEGG